MEWLTLEEFKVKGFDHTWCWINYNGEVELAKTNDWQFDSKFIIHVMPIPKPEAP